MSIHVASVVDAQGPSLADVRIYQAGEPAYPAQSWYWCCEDDGACSKHHGSFVSCLTEAYTHYEFTHREDHHEGQ